MLLYCILLYCSILYRPVLHCSTLPPGLNLFAVNDDDDDDDDDDNKYIHVISLLALQCVLI